MAGIAGIECDGKQKQVTEMLQKISHRGEAGSKVIESNGVTLGAVWPEAHAAPTPPTLQQQAAWDGSRPPLPDPATLEQEQEPFALTAALPDGLFMARDPLGICPLYYGRTDEGVLCFASEVKALLDVAQTVREVPPGTWYDGEQGFTTFAGVEQRPPSRQEPDEVAPGLRLRLERAVSQRVDDREMGCWLSGGLDSSAMAALARPHVDRLHTFSGGLDGAPDLEYARQVVDFLDTEHHEIIVTLDDLLSALPEVIYHLESFDALLVRSSITNYLVARRAADCVGAVFSGEGADELFGGYAYLKELDPAQIHDELVDITHRLHNTALQRVDRSASAHGLVAHVAFLDLEVVRFAMSIPSHLKLRRNGKPVEKWILRCALDDTLPDGVVWRGKSKFWQGAGVGDLLAQYAEQQITDADFKRERVLGNGWTLNSKEELMYYRLFREQFGDLEDLSWMGRTKGAPRN
jgi:asparagine synthase (glutamine-hydrolysing)